MFEQLFKRRSTVERYLSAPLVDCRLQYLAQCADSGAKLTTLQRIAKHQVEAIRILNLEENDRISVFEIKALSKEWSLPRSRSYDRLRSPKGEAMFVTHTVRWLRLLGWLDSPEEVRHPHVAEVSAFVDWMRRERGLSEHTIKSRRHLTDEFFDWLNGEGISLASLKITDIDRALAAKSAGGSCSRITINCYAKRLRIFLRYAEQRRWCVPGIAAAIMPPRVYLDETVPTGLAWQDVQRLLATTEGEKPTDKRDRAILLLFAVYGLRSGEVGGLQLDDIDWVAETLRVRRPKPGRTHLYPLSRSVGQAILCYLREVRPQRAERTVFFTHTAPIMPLSSGALSAIFRRRLQRLDIVSRHRGPHMLRHACAQHLLNQGLSMKQIGDYLGHRSLSSTAVYAKIDLARLREVADFDLEGLV